MGLLFMDPSHPIVYDLNKNHLKNELARRQNNVEHHLASFSPLHVRHRTPDGDAGQVEV